jgi:hypothetical protein
MADKEQIVSEKLEHEGLFSFPAVYKFAHSWLRNKNYLVNEKKYTEKVSGDKKDIKIEWEVSRKMSDYFKNDINIKFEITGMSEVEVEIDGKTKKMNQGKMLIEFKGSLIKDPNNEWNATPFYRFLRDTYNKYIIPKRVDDMEGKLFSDVTDLKDEIKALIEIAGIRK